MKVDVLVVGGGPGGTAAAFRAAELGLGVLVVDYDDLMKRIRDYSKDKLILPGFGGGDRMAFPAGGELLEALRFAPIDKDEMVGRWKGLYDRSGVDHRVGLELTGMERTDDAWRVQLWDHPGHAEVEVVARHVVLALGRGVPRRLDIPGNTEGIAIALEDPLDFVGAPCCVIGGGTSAAEAVIAISDAKERAGDGTEVFWSYRGDRMPRVSRALADRFFQAYVGNGNIRYHRRSEPVGVIVGDDHREYLSIRVDRLQQAGRPVQTQHLEFPREHCLACIGEDLPEELLRSLGIPMVVGGAAGRKRMVVNRFLETVQPNVHLVGDILSQVYLRTDDFDADPSGFEEVRHPGNIKSAMRDGVLVAQVIRQREDGAREIDVAVADLGEVAPSAEVADVMARLSGVHDVSSLREEAGPVHLVRVLRGGVQADETPLPTDRPTTIGRARTDLEFPDDEALAERHVALIPGDDHWTLRDEDGGGTVFLLVPSDRKIPLEQGDLLSAGHQFLVVEGTAEAPAIRHYDARGRVLGTHPLGERTLVLGRDAPDVVLDADDRGLSRRHIALSLEDGRVLVKDLKSLNGTLLRVRGEIPLEHGSRFRVGHQTFALSLDPTRILDTEPPPPPRPATGEVPLPGRSLAEGAPSVTFVGHGGPLPVAEGQTICDVAEQNGIPLRAECHSGICGSDPVRIVSGAEHLVAAPEAGEADTLVDLCGLEPGPCRLACMARVRGPVEVEIVEE